MVLGKKPPWKKAPPPVKKAPGEKSLPGKKPPEKVLLWAVRTYEYRVGRSKCAMWCGVYVCVCVCVWGGGGGDC